MLKSFFLNKKWALWAWGGFLFDHRISVSSDLDRCKN